MKNCDSCINYKAKSEERIDKLFLELKHYTEQVAHAESINDNPEYISEQRRAMKQTEEEIRDLINMENIK